MITHDFVIVRSHRSPSVRLSDSFGRTLPSAPGRTEKNFPFGISDRRVVVKIGIRAARLEIRENVSAFTQR